MKTTTMNLKTTALLALVLGTTAVSASASDWGFSFGFARPAVSVAVAAAPISTREWIPEHTESRDERVLVQAGHYERQVIPAVTETRRDRFGRPIVVEVTPARYTEVWVPDRYETRCVQVVVPGFYRELAVNNRIVVRDRDYRDNFDFRGGFRNDDHRYDRHGDHRNDRNDHHDDRNDHHDGRR